jgi:hypothetical protein
VLPSWPEPDFSAFHSINTPTSRSLTLPSHSENRLGVLPSPARSAFSKEPGSTTGTTTPHDDLVESVVRYSSHIVSPLSEEDRTPTQDNVFSNTENLLTPRAPNRMSHHQRVVSLLHPEEIIPDDGKEEPVSPISPEDEEETFPPVMKQGRTVMDPPIVPVYQKTAPVLQPTSLVSSEAPEDMAPTVTLADSLANGEITQNEAHPSSANRSRSSSDTWEKVSNPGTEPRSIIDSAGLHDDDSSIASEPLRSINEPKGKGRASTPPVERDAPFRIADSIGHSRDHSAASAIVGQAQVMQLKNVPIGVAQPVRPASVTMLPQAAKSLGPSQTAPRMDTTRRFYDQTDRMNEIAMAHRRMREALDQLSPTSPHDFGATDAAGRRFDSDRASMYAASERVNSIRAASFVAGSDKLSVRAGSERAPSISSASFSPESDRVSIPPGNSYASVNSDAAYSRRIGSPSPMSMEAPQAAFKLERHGPAPQTADIATVPQPRTLLPKPMISPPEPAVSPPTPVLSSPGMAMTVTKPDVSPEQDSMDSTLRTTDSLEPSVSRVSRSMPSVSSMGHDTDPDPSATQSPISNVSSVKTAFENREYHPPDPNRERPMSFVPLPRDPSGLPQQEMISTSKHPIDPASPQSPQDSRRSSTFGLPQRRSRQVSLQMDASDLYAPPSPKVERNAPKRELSLLQTSTDLAQPQRQSQPGPQIPLSVVQPFNVHGSSVPILQAPSIPQAPSNQSQGVQDIHNQVYRRETMDPWPPTPESKHPGPGPFPVDPPGGRAVKKPTVLQKLKGRSTPVPEPPLPSPPRISPQFMPVPDAQRMHSLTSTVASHDMADKDKKKGRGSGVFSGFKRPSSTGADSSLTGVSGDASSVKAEANESPTRGSHLQVPAIPTFTIPPSPQEAPQKKLADAKAKNKHLQRATTHTGEQPSKKKRFSSLGSLFTRSGTTGHTSNNKKLNKEPPKGTVIHHVPQNPTAFGSMQQIQASRGGSQSQGTRLSPIPFPPSYEDIRPPPGGYYAPGNTNNPAFGHVQGAAGFAAIVDQQQIPSAPPVTGNAGKDKRSASMNSPHWPLFGRNSSNGSSAGQMSPPISASSPADRFRNDSMGAPSISPVSTRRDSSPGGQPVYTRGPLPRGTRMGSITEGIPGQHQERPWALTLPGADEDDRDITRQEIFHAASARWQRGPDGLMYAIPRDVVSPTTPQSMTYGSPPLGSPQPPVHAQGSPANPVYSYLPTQVSSPPPPSNSPRHSADQHHLQQVVIPPLPQSQVQLMQPQPTRLSSPPVGGLSIASSTAPQSSPLQDPRLDPSYQSRGASIPAPPPKVPLAGLVTVLTSTTTSTTTKTEGSPQTVIKSPSSAGGAAQKTPISAVPSSVYSHVNSQSNSQPNSAVPRREGADSPVPPTPPAKDSPVKSSPPPLIIPGGPVGGRGVIGPIPTETSSAVSGAGAMGSSTRSMQAAMQEQQRHRRENSDGSGDEPVMKAVSYPGDEWMPSWENFD